MNTMLVLTISGSVLALLLMGLRYTVLRKMPSTVYYYAWLLVLLRFTLPLPGFVPTAANTESAEPAPVATAAYSKIDVQEDTDHDSEYVQNDITKSAPTEPVGTHINLTATEPKEMTVTETAPKAKFSFNWRSPKLWLSIWALGAIVSMGITVFSYLKFSFYLKRNLMEPDSFTKEVYASIPGRKPALYFSDSARTPMMLGVFKPKIVLPFREYNEELLINILRHELTHYRRFDALYKWASVTILSVHWFNPVAWFIRKEINRSCEMSCDEMLLRSMDRAEKQSYGDSLLLMAASTALPSAVVATSFATEKRNLKERLVQIMSYRKSGTRILAAALTVVLLTGCGVAAGPVHAKASEAQAAAPKIEGGVVKVKTVDEFLKAIAPNTVIELAEGEYDLSKAKDYAKESKSSYYSWNLELGDGAGSAELIIHDVEGLTIRGAGIGKTTVAAVPRYAHVLRFRACNKLTVSNLTAGHTKQPGTCTGGVIYVENCSDANVDSCGLYGCGTEGVSGFNSEKLNITNCDIYECSDGAISASLCKDVLISGCDIHDHGTKEIDSSAYRLFEADETNGFTVYNCKIHDSKAEELLCADGSKNVFFISNEVTKNTLSECTFDLAQYEAVIDGCHFEGNYTKGWYKEGAKIKATDINGKELDAAQFTAMKLRDIKPESVVPKASPTPTPSSKAKNNLPKTGITVTTTDEFLSAIGSDRTIILDGTSFDLTKAKNYGWKGTEFYSWAETPDGPELVIRDVKNLTITAKKIDPAATTFEALPRCADVLSFVNCENITVDGFTAGHKKDYGGCSGGVLDFDKCKNIKVQNMRLYGCGTLGIETYCCNDIDIINTEIYECSNGAAYFRQTIGINFKDCNIHDVPSPALDFYECERRTWNGQKFDFTKYSFDVKPDGTLVAVDQ